VVATLITRAEPQITQLGCRLARRSNCDEPFVCWDSQTHLAIFRWFMDLNSCTR